MRAAAIRLSYLPSLIFLMGILMAKGLYVVGMVNPSQPILELTASDYLGFTGVSRISLSSPFLGSPRPSRLFVIR